MKRTKKMIDEIVHETLLEATSRWRTTVVAAVERAFNAVGVYPPVMKEVPNRLYDAFEGDIGNGWKIHVDVLRSNGTMYVYMLDPNDVDHGFDGVEAAAKHYAQVARRRGKKAKERVATITYDDYEGTGFEFKGKYHTVPDAGRSDADTDEELDAEIVARAAELAKMMLDLGVEHVRDPEGEDPTRLYAPDEWAKKVATDLNPSSSSRP